MTQNKLQEHERTELVTHPAYSPTAALSAVAIPYTRVGCLPGRHLILITLKKHLKRNNAGTSVLECVPPGKSFRLPYLDPTKTPYCIQNTQKVSFLKKYHPYGTTQATLGSFGILPILIHHLIPALATLHQSGDVESPMKESSLSGSAKAGISVG